MFCPNCGKQTDDKALFCSECGTKIEVKEEKKVQDDTVSSETQNCTSNVQSESIIEKFKKLGIKEKIILIEIVVLVIAFVWVNQYIDKNNTPTKAVEGFLYSLSNGDYKKAYEYCDLPNSEFVTKDRFVETLEKGLGSLDWSEVKSIKTEKGSKEDGKTRISVKVINKDGDDEDFGSFYVSKSGKKFLFLDSYKIDVEKLVIEDYKIYVPKDAKVTFGGVALDDKYITKIDDKDDFYKNMTLYEIPNVIADKYDIEVKLGDIGCKVDKADTSEGSYYCSSVKVSDDELKKVCNQAAKDFETIMKSAAEHKDVSEIENLFTQDEKSDVESYYKQLCEAFDLSEGEGLYDVNFSSININVESSSTEDDIEVSSELSYNFDCKGAKKDWWTGELQQSDSSNSEKRFFNYKYVDGKWLISDAYGALNEMNY